VSEPLVIVGNGMAAARLVDEMTRCALARHTMAVIGDEPRGPKPGMVISRRAVSSFCAIKPRDRFFEVAQLHHKRHQRLAHFKRDCFVAGLDQRSQFAGVSGPLRGDHADRILSPRARKRSKPRKSNGAKATGATAFSTFRRETATNLFPYRRKPRFDVSDTCKDLDLELVERVLVGIVAVQRSEVRIPSAPASGIRTNTPHR
jgi:hypothetical protein